ncbi:MAG: prolipoprotein diacylglyceryl transferase [Tepidisphaeraceae bacterium]
MLQEVFRIPFVDLPIYGYGLMLVIGFLLAVRVGQFLARRVGVDPELVMNAGLLALVTGILGARVSHILENLPEFTRHDRSMGSNLLSMLNIRSGGLTYYGGFLVAFPVLVWYALHKRIPVRLGMDIVAPGLMIGLGIGRIGCFMNGCCYGAQCDLPWAVRFPYDSIPYQDEFVEGKVQPPHELILDNGAGRPELMPARRAKSIPALSALASNEHSRWLHPAQLYSTITAVLIAAICVAYFTLPHAPGRVFAMMLILEGPTRYLLELLRVEPPVVSIGTHGLSLSMVLGIGIFVLGGILWMVFGHRPAPAIAPAPSA